MNTLEIIKQRSSTRSYSGRPLSEQEIQTLIHAGLQAPTATNRREIHFSVLKSSNPILGEIEAEKNRLREEEPAQNFYYDAPTVIILGAESAFKWSPVDAGIAVENIALAAEDLGLGSVIIGCIYDALRGEKSEYFNKALNFPEGYVYEIAIAVGYKASEKEPHTYEEDTQVTYLD